MSIYKCKYAHWYVLDRCRNQPEPKNTMYHFAKRIVFDTCGPVCKLIAGNFWACLKALVDYIFAYIVRVSCISCCVIVPKWRLSHSLPPRSLPQQLNEKDDEEANAEKRL